MRMADRSISREMVLGSVDRFQIIESYPDDKFLPSYLIYSQSGETIIHILMATDTVDDNVRIVTAYLPDPTRWSDDLKQRIR